MATTVAFSAPVMMRNCNACMEQQSHRTRQCSKLVLRSDRLRVLCAAAAKETLETVRKVIASQLSVDEAIVTPDAKFSDLGADSLDTVEIMMNLEESFKVSLGEEGAEKIVTVEDAANLIQEVISKT